MTIKVKITREENAAHFKKEIGDVVTVPLEEYVAAVVASEIGNAHVEACKAQAVAARTFAYPYYSNGTTITDASSTHQAYRAPRFNEKAYPNAIRGACATSGQLLFYNGSVIGTCSYSASDNHSSSYNRTGAVGWLPGIASHSHIGTAIVFCPVCSAGSLAPDIPGDQISALLNPSDRASPSSHSRNPGPYPAGGYGCPA